MVDLADPAHVGDVDHAVDVVLDLDEGAVAGHVADLALDAGALRILLLDQLPGIRLGLAQPKGNLALVLVDGQDDCVHLVPNVQHVAGTVDLLGPAHLSDVDETLDALLKLHKGTVGHDVDDLAVDTAVDRILDVRGVPGIAFLLLEAKGDTLALLVHLEDHDLEFLVLVDDCVRVGDAAPAHVGDVEQAIHAVEVDECAKVGDVLDNALADLAGLELLKQLCTLAGALLLENLPAGEDDVLALGVDLDDLELKLLADVDVEVAGSPNVHLGTGKEGLDAHIHDETALDSLGDLAGDEGTLGVIVDDVIPCTLALGLLDGDLGRAALAFKTLHVDFEGVALLQIVEVLEIAAVNEGLGLAADVQEDSALFLSGNLADDDGVFLDGICLGGCFSCQQLFHRRHIV